MSKQKQKQETFDDLITSDIRRKPFITYLVAAIVITLLLGLVSIININVFLPGLLIKACQIILFLGCGVMYTFQLNDNLSFPDIKYLGTNKLVFSIFLFVLISIVLLLLYLFTNIDMIGMSLASSGSFLLPYVIQQAWKTYNNLPPKRYKLWYNSDVVMDSRTTVFLNSLPIRLRLSLKYFDISDQEFEVTVPGHTQFGKFFNQFIIEKNKNNASAIECVDMEKKPFGWQFFIEHLGGLRKHYIDPELSLRDNNVKDNSIITVKRQRTAETLIELPGSDRKALPQINRTATKINKHEAGK